MSSVHVHSGTGPLPLQVKKLLESNSYVHLGTSSQDIPHVSLMNYTFITEGPNHYIFLTTPKNTQKYRNIELNKNVSILIHDWTRTENTVKDTVSDSNSLLQFLQNLNQTELCQVSATLTGEAEILSPDDDKLQEYKQKHLEMNPNAKAFIDGDQIAYLLVKITSSKVADNYNNVDRYL